MMDGRQMIRALFLDVDGTIISTRTKKIPESASEAIRKAREAGVKRLLVGHFSARYDNEELLLEQARAVFPETLLAKETLCVPI